MNTPFQPPDSADFMNKLWSGWSGSLNLPSMLTPTLNLEEIDRRINELKTVEHWLNVNQNMLRNTIQGLEVQRGTLAALQTFSASLGQAANAAAQEPADNSPPPAQTQFAEAMQQGSALWWDLLQQQFSHLAKAAAQTPAQSSTQTPAQDPAPKTEASTEAPAKPAARSNKTSRS
ncbi:MAG: hypothetical protein EPO06_04215 [Burkholderiaceae bacterium]|nr:MAG: hypothetical protein EPO06_04215 [Burkholderiaceae bacterium]